MRLRLDVTGPCLFGEVSFGSPFQQPQKQPVVFLSELRRRLFTSLCESFLWGARNLPSLFFALFRWTGWEVFLRPLSCQPICPSGFCVLVARSHPVTAALSLRDGGGASIVFLLSWQSGQISPGYTRHSA